MVRRSTVTLDAGALRAELAELAAELAHAGLRPEHRYAALGHLGAAAQEAARPEPDAVAVGSRVARAAIVLRNSGALTAGGTALVGSLSRIAALLGPANPALLTLV